MLCSLLESGELAKHITHTLCPAYHKRWAAMMAEIEAILLPLGITVVKGADSKTAGGYFIWLTLPDNLHGQAADVVKFCLDKENLIVGGGKLFQVPGDEGVRFDDNIRLSFAWEAEDELVDGVKRLGRCVDRLLRSDKGLSNGDSTAELSQSHRGQGVDAYA